MPLFHFTLDSGLHISIEALYQLMTYRALMGTLDAKRTERILATISEHVQMYWRGNCPYYVLPPNIYTLPEDSIFQRLPAVECFAYAATTKPVKDPSKDGSELILVWFQDQVAPPIAPLVEQQIKALPWNELAQDYEIW